jgi:sterol 14-demethylase
MKEVMAELEAVYGEDDTVTYQSLRDIVKTERAVKETLRLHPPLFMLLRAVMQDFEYKGYHVPAGSRVVVTPYVAHRMRSQFRDPERFDPDRFSPEREEDKIPFAFIPFGGGRHKCMGSAFAYLQVKAIIAVLLRAYEFELSGDPIASDFHGLVVGPKQPCRIRYRRRRSKAVHAVPGTLERAGTNGRPVARMKITVDTDLCQGHAVCTSEAPTVFEVGPDERVRVLDASPAESLHERVRLARKHCPTGAITLVEG